MPEFVQFVMLGAPTTHFIILAQSILFRGAGLFVVLPQFIALAVIGADFFSFSLRAFGTMACSNVSSVKRKGEINETGDCLYTD
jgi:hypothetical protein